MQRRGLTGDMIYLVVHRKDMGGMMTEERIDMMMMVVPTHIILSRNEKSLWLLFPVSE